MTDEEILEAKAVVDGCGVGCEPASAASVAGLRALVRRRQVDARRSDVVAVLTGHVLKDPGSLLQYHRETEPPRPARTGRSRSSRSWARWSGCWLAAKG